MTAATTNDAINRPTGASLLTGRVTADVVGGLIRIWIDNSINEKVMNLATGQLPSLKLGNPIRKIFTMLARNVISHPSHQSPQRLSLNTDTSGEVKIHQPSIDNPTGEIKKVCARRQKIWTQIEI